MRYQSHPYFRTLARSALKIHYLLVSSSVNAYFVFGEHIGHIVINALERLGVLARGAVHLFVLNFFVRTPGKILHKQSSDSRNLQLYKPSLHGRVDRVNFGENVAFNTCRTSCSSHLCLVKGEAALASPTKESACSQAARSDQEPTNAHSIQRSCLSPSAKTWCSLRSPGRFTSVILQRHGTKCFEANFQSKIVKGSAPYNLVLFLLSPH